MKQTRLNYHSYLLRLWRSSGNTNAFWHIMLENPHTGERHSFTSFAGLMAFLNTVVAQAPAVGVDEGGDMPT